MYFNQKVEGEITPQETAVSNVQATNDTDPVSRAKALLALHQSLPNGINFELTADLALECIDDILENWLPDGERRGSEYAARNPTRNDSELGSFSINVRSGIWGDFAAGDFGGDVISFVAYLASCNQATAAVTILEFIAGLSTDIEAVVKRTKHAEAIKAKPKFQAIVPIPSEASRSRPVFFGANLGGPSAVWEYRNAAGQPMCFVLRFDTAEGKVILPQTYCMDDTGHCKWVLQALPSPRPAYGLDRLAARPAAPVLFTEGEKSADAAQRLFPECVCTTTSSGAKSPEKTDFSPFKGRKVYIAPDNDEAGTAYKDRLIELLNAAGAEVVGVMRFEALRKSEKLLDKGYDLADAERDGWTADALKALGDTLWAPATPYERTLPLSTANVDESVSGGDKKKRTQLELVIEFAQQNHGGHIAVVNNQILAYGDGYWAVLDPASEVKRPILEIIGETGTAAQVRGVFDLLSIQYASKPETFERRSPLICLNNGTLDPVTGVLHKHSVDHFLTNKLDIEYDVKTQCPLWIQTLDEIFAPDQDKEAKVRLVQEYIGYCLIPDTRMHKFLWMVGSGGNGKSLILAVITALIGKTNISYAQIERLQEKFVRAELQGKLVNISSEMSAQATVADGYLKQITAGDIIEAERKNQTPFSFKPYARLIGATNSLPRLLDHSDGFFRRAVVVRFNRQFTAHEIDTQREAKLMVELPGILNWAVAGLQRLLERGAFDLPESSRLEIDQYKVNSDPVRQFAEDFLVRIEDRTRWTGGMAIYEYYREWSLKNGYVPLGSNKLAERLISIGFVKEKRRDGRYWNAEYRDPVFERGAEVVTATPRKSLYVV